MYAGGRVGQGTDALQSSMQGNPWATTEGWRGMRTCRHLLRCLAGMREHTSCDVCLDGFTPASGCCCSRCITAGQHYLENASCARVATQACSRLLHHQLHLRRLVPALLVAAGVAHAMAEIGRAVAALHDGGLIHGDLTTSNMMLRDADKRLVGGGEQGGGVLGQCVGRDCVCCVLHAVRYALA